MKTFTSVLAALIVAPILLIGGCTVMLSMSMAEDERTVRRCMAQSSRTRRQCERALYRATQVELDEALNELGKAMGR